MVSILEKQNSNGSENWKNRLSAIDLSLKVDDPFPDRGSFYGSIWHIWTERIEDGQNKERARIQQTYQLNGHYFDVGGLTSDEYWQSRQVTNSMYAALVVSIWSKIESFLQSIVSVCIEGHKKRKKILMKIKNFCDYSLSGKEPETTLDDCIEDLKNLKKTKMSHKFKEVTKTLEFYKINVKKRKNYEMINAIRILNNSYKHNDGRYRPTEKNQNTQIDENLLSKWQILKNKNEGEIDYTKLPIQDIVIACNSFCNDLLEKTKKQLT